MMKFIVMLLLLLPLPVQAEVYIDLGMSYIKDIDVVSSISRSFNEFELTLSVDHTLEIDMVVPLLRVGYLKSGWGVEWDYIGTPKINIQRINLFHRWEF